MRLGLPFAVAGSLALPAFAQHAQVGTLTTGGTSSLAPVADLSRDGRWLVYSASQNDPGAGDTDVLQDVWLRDLLVGTRYRASVDETGQPFVTLQSGVFEPIQGFVLANLSVSDGGERVAYLTQPSTFPTPFAAQVRVYDRVGGTSQLVSRTPGGAQGDGASSGPVLSGDGRHVVFVSYAGDLVAGDGDNVLDLFARDLVTQTTTRIAQGLPYIPAQPGHDISPNGRYVVCSLSVATGGTSIVEIDRDSDADGVFDEPGTVVPREVLRNVPGQMLVSIARSPSGRHLAYLRLNSQFGTYTVARFDRDSDANGILDEVGGTADVSIAPCTRPPFAEGVCLPYHPSISSDGNRVVWMSARAGPYWTEAMQVYSWDGTDGVIRIQSYDEVTGAASKGGFGPRGAVISGDGQRIVACLNSSNMVPGDPSGIDVLVIRYDVAPVGLANYCIGAPNSVGNGARLGWSGVPSRSQNFFSVTASGCPPNSLGLFYYGPNTQQAPFGNGWRCVAGTIYRLGTRNIDSLGNSSIQVRFDLPPANTGPGAWLPGTGWNVQLYYRNPAAGGAGFNASDGLHVPVYP